MPSPMTMPDSCFMPAGYPACTMFAREEYSLHGHADVGPAWFGQGHLAREASSRLAGGVAG